MNDFESKPVNELPVGAKFKLLVDEDVKHEKKYPRYCKVSKYDDLASPEFTVIKKGQYQFISYDYEEAEYMAYECYKHELLGYAEGMLSNNMQVAVKRSIKKSEYILDAAKFFGLGFLVGGIPPIAIIIGIFSLMQLLSRKEKDKQFWRETIVEQEPLSKVFLVIGFFLGLSVIYPVTAHFFH